MTALTILSLYGYAAALVLLTKRRFGHLLFAATSCLVVFLYVCGLLGFLHQAARVAFVVGLASCLGSAAALMNGRVRLRAGREFLSAPFLACVLLTAVAFAALRDARLRQWDEFTHWGLAVKAMLGTNALPLRGNALQFPDYPPATTLLEYYFGLNGSSTEGDWYLAHSMLVIAPLASLLSAIAWRNWLWAAATFVLFAGLGHQWAPSLMVEYILTAFFAAAVCLLLSSEKTSFKLACLIPALFVLPLVKQAGAFFAALFLVVAAVDALAGRLSDGKRPRLFGAGALRIFLGGLSQDAVRRRAVLVLLVEIVSGLAIVVAARILSGTSASLAALGLLGAALALSVAFLDRRLFGVFRSGIARAGNAAVLAVLFAAVIASYASWKVYSRGNSLRESWRQSADSGYAATFAALTGRAADDKSSVCRSFVDALWQRPPAPGGGSTAAGLLRQRLPSSTPALNVRLSAAGWFAVWLGMGAVAFASDRRRRVSIAAAFSVLALGFAVYLFGCLRLYLFAFTSPETLALSQFERYVSCYLAAAVFIGWVLMTRRDNEGIAPRGWPSRIARVAAVCIACLVLFFECSLWPFAARQAQWRTDLLAAKAAQLDSVRSATPAGSWVFIVFQDSSGFEHKALGFELWPRHWNLRFNSLGVTASGYASWDVAADALERVLRGYDYVYLAKDNPELWSRYGALFDPGANPSDFLFSVEYHSDGHVVLRPVRAGESPAARTAPPHPDVSSEPAAVDE